MSGKANCSWVIQGVMNEGLYPKYRPHEENIKPTALIAVSDSPRAQEQATLSSNQKF